MKSFFEASARGAQKMAQASAKMEKSASDLKRRTYAMKIRTKARLNEEWFRMCRLSLRAALDYVEHVVQLDEKLNADPELKKIFLELDPDYGKQMPREPEPAWVRAGRPSAPTSAMENPGDPLEMQLRQEGFDEAVVQHEELIRSIRRDLARKPALREPFKKELACRGLGQVLREEFPDF
ncbi:hypothetical protein [Roseovarius sp. ZX-A-9]|uniref:hypothetical protein n=1 Tax=Roseovarius sp. ZX-A-9 TaxID=3014783 RepID=UPI00232C0F02|nr:hypothetical protein [Roseovarius sp. ZX-A-9]